MKFTIMQQVYIQSDILNVGAPVEHTGYIVRIDPMVYDARTYLVRVPDKKEQWWLPECDLVDSQTWTSDSADKVIQDSIVDYALSHKNEEMFKSAMNN